VAYGLAEGLRKTRIKLGRKNKTGASVIATFGNHFIMNEALEEIRGLGLEYTVQKDHIVTIQLGKNGPEVAEKIRKIIRDHYGYVEPE
jgi:hypothetical protein